MTQVFRPDGQVVPVTLLKADDDLLRLWDAPVSTPGLRWGV